MRFQGIVDPFCRIRQKIRHSVSELDAMVPYMSPPNLFANFINGLETSTNAWLHLEYARRRTSAIPCMWSQVPLFHTSAVYEAFHGNERSRPLVKHCCFGRILLVLCKMGEVMRYDSFHRTDLYTTFCHLVANLSQCSYFLCPYVALSMFCVQNIGVRIMKTIHKKIAAGGAILHL